MSYPVPLTEGALVLEGGGMRGAFTTGVLDYMLEKNMVFDRVYGVSAGACHACSYLSLQPGRAFRVVADYINDPRYMSFFNLLKGEDVFPAEFVYHTIPDGLDPYDYKTIKDYPGKFYAVATDCNSGGPHYFEIDDLRKDIDKVRASASLPLMSHMVKIDGGEYLDGGMSDSIPVKKALADGAKKCVVVLTRAADYIKEPGKTYLLARLTTPRHKGLINSLRSRHLMYNETTCYIKKAEAAGKIFVFRPEKERLDVSRLEKDRSKLERLYAHGHETAKANHGRLLEYLDS